MMKTFKEYFDNKDKITKAFLNKRHAAPKNFWCHTKEATEFYRHWDRKWGVITKYFQQQLKEICAQKGLDTVK